MTLPDQPPQPEGTKKTSAPQDAQPEVEFPGQAQLPEGFTPFVRSGDLESSSRARRRRARRSLILPAASDRATHLDELAHRALPSLEFFLLAFISGLILGAGYLLDSHALLLLGLLFAPLLGPWVGMTLGIAIGGWRLFFQTFFSLLVAFLAVFITSAAVGLAARLLGSLPLLNADIHSHLWWPDLVVVAVGAVLLKLVFLRGERRPVVPSVMLAYGLFLPLSAAGFGLGLDSSPLWPDGILVFLTHLSLATLAGLIVLALLRYKPRKASTSLLGIIIGLLCVAALVVFTGLAGWVIEKVEFPEPAFTPAPLGLASPTLGLPPSGTPGDPTQTHTPSPSKTSTPTITSTPTPTFAVIGAETGGGANFRTEPGGGDVITTLLNGTIVEVLPETQTILTTTWVHIRTLEGIEGWVLQVVLNIATPAQP